MHAATLCIVLSSTYYSSSRISISDPPGNLVFVFTVGLSLTILAWLGLLVKLTEEEDEVMEKGEDVLVKIFVLGAVGEGAIVNFERWDIICWPTILVLLDAGLLILWKSDTVLLWLCGYWTEFKSKTCNLYLSKALGAIDGVRVEFRSGGELLM